MVGVLFRILYACIGHARARVAWPATQEPRRQNIMQSSVMAIFVMPKNYAAEGGTKRLRPRLLLGRTLYIPYLNAALGIFPTSAFAEYCVSFLLLHIAELSWANKCAQNYCTLPTQTVPSMWAV
jgi:hypothetical protein